jgi:hypothetical protein
MVASMLGLDVEEVNDWWEGQMKRLRGYKAMSMWIGAREVEGIRRAKLLDLY